MAESGGFESRNITEGLEILSSMIENQDCLKFLSFIGAIVSTGFRGIIKDMIKKKWFDVVFTTCGALDHDIARHFQITKRVHFLWMIKYLQNKICTGLEISLCQWKVMVL